MINIFFEKRKNLSAVILLLLCWYSIWTKIKITRGSFYCVPHISPFKHKEIICNTSAYLCFHIPISESQTFDKLNNLGIIVFTWVHFITVVNRGCLYECLFWVLLNCGLFSLNSCIRLFWIFTGECLGHTWEWNIVLFILQSWECYIAVWNYILAFMPSLKRPHDKRYS